MKHPKFKYLKGSDQEIELVEEDFKEVECPLPYNSLPDGEYLIRGTVKEHRKKYWKVEGRWFLIDTVAKFNGHSTSDAVRYMLFPCLPTKEWDRMLRTKFNRFNKLWQRNIDAYRHWREMRVMIRDMKKDFLTWDKEDKNEKQR